MGRPVAASSILLSEVGQEMTLAELPTYPTAPAVMAAGLYRTNADLIVAVAKLGYIRDHDDVIDLTYGRGNWWKKFKPGSLVHSDNWDFTALPTMLDEQFDVAVFDPPYVSTGGRTTSTIPEFNDRYGLTDSPSTPWLMHHKNTAGLENAMRVVKPGGLILCKCMDYVSSGRLFMGSHLMWEEAMTLGLTVRDRLLLIGRARMQPPGRPQEHARNNFSTLYVFQKGTK